MSVRNLERFLSVISDIGVKEIDMLGGEPTLYSHFHELIELIKEKNLKTTISTNGSAVEILKELSKTCNGNQTRVGVSVNSDVITQELHEYIMDYRPIVKSVCTGKRTMPEAARAYLGLMGIEYYLLYRDTIYKEDLEKSLPFSQFYKKIDQLKEIYNNVEGVFCSGFLPDTQTHPVLEKVRCPAGTTKIAVLPDGSVYPCYLFVRNEEFRIGNILVNDFDRIWKNPVLDFFRKFEKNNCTHSECELFNQCHGGCPAVSFLIYNDITAPDPRCVLHR